MARDLSLDFFVHILNLVARIGGHEHTPGRGRAPGFNMGFNMGFKYQYVYTVIRVKHTLKYSWLEKVLKFSART